MDAGATPDVLVQGLGETVERIEVATRAVDAERLKAAPAPGEWSANEILWHIRAVADVYSEQVHRILAEGSPSWEHVSPRQRMKKARYDLVPFDESLAAFRRQREELVTLLAALDAGAWERLAMVNVRGKEWRLTLHERVAGMVSHERIHCGEIEWVVGVMSDES